MKLTIETSSGKKGRSFSAELFSYVECDTLWENGKNGSACRPIYMAFGGSTAEIRSFLMNFRMGRVAEVEKTGYSRKAEKFEWMKTAGYAHHVQKVGDGVCVYAYLSELFQPNPGMVDPDYIKFCMLPSKAWVSQRVVDVETVDKALKGVYILPKDLSVPTLGAMADLFRVYLDGRTRYPIPTETAFNSRLLLRCIKDKVIVQDTGSYSSYGDRFSYQEHGLDKVGLMPGFAFACDHETFNTILSDEVLLWHDYIR